MACHNMPFPPNGAISEASSKTLAQGTIFPVADYTTGTYTSQEYFNYGRLGLRLIIDVNNVNSTGTLAVNIELYDPVSAAWYDMPETTTTSITAAGQNIYQLGPDVEEDNAAGVTSVSAMLPARFRIKAVVGTQTVNFSVSGELLG